MGRRQNKRKSFNAIKSLMDRLSLAESSHRSVADPGTTSSSSDTCSEFAKCSSTQTATKRWILDPSHPFFWQLSNRDTRSSRSSTSPSSSSSTTSDRYSPTKCFTKTLTDIAEETGDTTEDDAAENSSSTNNTATTTSTLIIKKVKSTGKRRRRERKKRRQKARHYAKVDGHLSSDGSHHSHNSHNNSHNQQQSQTRANELRPSVLAKINQTRRQSHRLNKRLRNAVLQRRVVNTVLVQDLDQLSLS